MLIVPVSVSPLEKFYVPNIIGIHWDECRSSMGLFNGGLVHFLDRSYSICGIPEFLNFLTDGGKAVIQLSKSVMEISDIVSSIAVRRFPKSSFHFFSAPRVLRVKDFNALNFATCMNYFVTFHLVNCAQSTANGIHTIGDSVPGFVLRLVRYFMFMTRNMLAS